MPTQILLADDHAILRETISHLLQYKRNENYVVIGEAEDALETLTRVARHKPDILLLDYDMPGVGRLSTFCRQVLDQSSKTRILLLSGYADEEIALEAALGGAHGYILKGAAFNDLVKAIDTIQSGGVWVDEHLPPRVFHTFLNRRGAKNDKLRSLSRQELKILARLAEGLSNKEIALQVHISQKTVKNHLTHIFAKLGVEHRRQAILYFMGDRQRSAQANNRRKSA